MTQQNNTQDWGDVSPWVVLPGLVALVAVFAFLAAKADHYPVRKANGQVIQVPADSIPWHRKDRNRPYAWDEIHEGEFRGTNRFNLP